VLLEKDDNDGYSVQRDGSNVMKMNVGSSGGEIKTLNTYNDGKWHNFVFVYRGVNDATAYVDGVDDTDIAGPLDPGTPAYSTDGLTIGSRDGSFPFLGTIDDIRIYDRALTAPEVAAIYHSSTRGATWAAAQDTAITGLYKDNPRRLRFEVSNNGAAASAAVTYQLEYATTIPGGPWTTVPNAASAEHWETADSTYLTDGEATINLPSGLADENTTFVSGELRDALSVTSGITLTQTEFTEIEYSIQATSNAIDSTTYYFRLVDGGVTETLTYPQYGQVTLSAGCPGGSVCWDGGGADNKWSTAANWTGDAVPGSAALVVFNGLSTKNATFDVLDTIGSLTIESDYTGRITMAADLTNDGAFTQNGGTIDFGATTVTHKGNWTYTAGTLTPNASTVVFGKNASSATITGSHTLFNVTFDINATGVRT